MAKINYEDIRMNAALDVLAGKEAQNVVSALIHPMKDGGHVADFTVEGFEATIPFYLQLEVWENDKPVKGEEFTFGQLAPEYVQYTASEKKEIRKDLWALGYSSVEPFFDTIDVLQEKGVIGEFIAAYNQVVNRKITKDSSRVKALIAKEKGEKALEQLKEKNVAFGEGFTLDIFAYHKDGEFKLSLVEKSIGSVCGYGALPERFIYFEEFHSNTEDPEEAERIRSLIKGRKAQHEALSE